MAPSRGDAPSTADRIRVSRPALGLENTFGIASGLDRVGLPLRCGLGGRDRLACTSVAQAIRIDSVAEHQGNGRPAFRLTMTVASVTFEWLSGRSQELYRFA